MRVMFGTQTTPFALKPQLAPKTAFTKMAIVFALNTQWNLTMAVAPIPRAVLPILTGWMTKPVAAFRVIP